MLNKHLLAAVLMWLVGLTVLFFEQYGGGQIQTFVTGGAILYFIAFFIGTPLAAIGLIRAVREKSTINIAFGVLYFLWFAVQAYSGINGLGALWIFKIIFS